LGGGKYTGKKGGKTPRMLWKKGAANSPLIKHFALIIRRAAASR
jgi:hypothetical protein